MAIELKSLTEFIEDFLAVIEAETGVPIDTRVGSVMRALASAASTNDIFLQSMVEQVRQNMHLPTADDDSADAFVNQFAPKFPPRILAKQAAQGPVTPTSLTAPAALTYLVVGSVQKLNPTQTVSLLRSGKQATVTVDTVEPTTTLTADIANGATVLPVTSTEGMVVGAVLDIVDGNYAASVTIQNVNSSTTVTTSPATAAITHTFNKNTTVITLRKVLRVSNYVFTSGTVLADLTPGTEVRALTLLEGQRFWRASADNTTPSIPAKTIDQAGYRVQTKINSVQYEVVADLTNPNYDSVAKAYKIPANALDVYVKVEAVTAGAASNVAAGQLTVLPSPLTGIDGTNNPYAISNGTDRESTAALIERFQDFIASNGSSNRPAMEAALKSVSTDIEFTLLENKAADGVTPKRGNFVVLVGDTQGVLTDELLSQVLTAVEKNRPLTSTYDVFPPTLARPVFVLQLTLDVSDGTVTEAQVRSLVAQAICDHFVGLDAGVSWNFNEILAMVMDIDHVTDVPYLTINGNGYSRTTGSFAVVGTGPQNGVVGALVQTRPQLADVTVS